MGSSRPTDRSIGEATFLPQWMKGKLETRFDYSEGTFSPPTDDTFFYIGYPKRQDSSATSTTSDNKYPSESGSEPKVIVANKPKIKAPSANDDFGSDKTFESGRSIVSVASQIMSSKFGKFSSADSSSSNQDQSDDSKKFSKSLPATPLTSPGSTPEGSPKARRRVYANRFFTGAFVPDPSQQKNGWLLSSILGSRELITPKIDEEEEPISSTEQLPSRALTRKKSISSQNLTYIGGKDDKQQQQQQPQLHRIGLLQAKPSELREMNFWSPTSM